VCFLTQTTENFHFQPVQNTSILPES